MQQIISRLAYNMKGKECHDHFTVVTLEKKW